MPCAHVHRCAASYNVIRNLITDFAGNHCYRRIDPNSACARQGRRGNSGAAGGLSVRTKFTDPAPKIGAILECLDVSSWLGLSAKPRENPTDHSPTQRGVNTEALRLSSCERLTAFRPASWRRHPSIHRAMCSRRTSCMRIARGVGRPVQASPRVTAFMRRFLLLMPLFMQLFILRILLLSLCSLRPVLLYRRSDLFQAVSLALAAPEGVLVGLAEDALRDRGNERVVFVVKRIFGLDDMRGEQHLELLGL